MRPGMMREISVLLFTLLFPTFMTWRYFVVPAGQTGEDNPFMRLVFSLGKIVQFAVPLVYVWLLGELVFTRPSFSPPEEREQSQPPGTILLSLGFGLLTLTAILGLYHFILKGSELLASTPERIWQKVQEFGCTTPAQFLMLAAFISLLHSLLEEYYWRWFVFGRLRRLLPLSAALLISSLGFMAHHVILLAVYFPGAWLTLIVPFSLAVAVGGGVWAWLYQRSGSLLGPWLSHLIVDVALMWVGYDMIAPWLE